MKEIIALKLKVAIKFLTFFFFFFFFFFAENWLGAERVKITVT